MTLTFLILLTAPQTAYSQETKSSTHGGVIRRVEKGLKDQEYFFYFIDSTITNSGSDEEKDIFIEAIRRDLIARMLHLRFEFNPAMKEIIKIQELLITLYSKAAIREIENANNLFKEISQGILNGSDSSAKNYLALGYRSADSAKKMMMKADHLPEKNYSIRIYEYVKSIKSAKYGKRYAILAFIESMVPPSKKVKLDNNKYDIVQDLINQYIPENKERYSAIHFDNFYKIDPSKSVYNVVSANPELEKIPEYKDYLKGK